MPRRTRLLGVWRLVSNAGARIAHDHSLFQRPPAPRAAGFRPQTMAPKSCAGAAVSSVSRPGYGRVILKPEIALLLEHMYPADEWRLVEAWYPAEFADRIETCFSLGNGFAGIRGSLDEGRARRRREDPRRPWERIGKAAA